MHSHPAMITTFLLVILSLLSSQDKKVSGEDVSGEIVKRLFRTDHQSLNDKEGADKDLDLLDNHKHRLNKLDLLQQIIRGNYRVKRQSDPVQYGTIVANCSQIDQICLQFSIPAELLRQTIIKADLWVRTNPQEDDPFGLTLSSPTVPTLQMPIKPHWLKFDMRPLLKLWAAHPEEEQLVTVSCQHCAENMLAMPLAADGGRNQPMVEILSF